MRPKQRLPAIYKFFKLNKAKFNEFLGLNNNQVVEHQRFIAHYEELFYQHIQYPDLRFGQHMYNNGIVLTDGGYYKEEGAWLIGNNLVKPEEVVTWGTWGLQIQERMEAWKATAPKLNAPVTEFEKAYFGYANLKNYEVYARRYEIWQAQKPKKEYKLLKDLDSDHIRAILLTETHLPEVYRKGLEEILKSREETSPPPLPETLKILGSDVKCD